MLPIPLSPQPLKIPLFTVFSSIFPCSNAGQHIYKKSFQNIVFDSVFPMFPVKQTVIYTFFAIKAVNPPKTLLFDSVRGMLPVKHTVIYTFFAITSVQNTCFCSVFNALASKNPAKSCYVQHFWPFFHCRWRRHPSSKNVAPYRWLPPPPQLKCSDCSNVAFSVAVLPHALAV